MLQEVRDRRQARIARINDTHARLGPEIMRIGTNPATHWSFALYAARLLRALIRRDRPMATDVATYFAGQLLSDNPNMRKMVDDIKQDVAAGNSLANSLRKQPQYFDDLYCNLVDAGEQSGALETLLDRVATYKEKTEALKKKIKKAMTYPAAVIVVAVIVSAILLIKVVPQFQSVPKQNTPH